MFSKMLLGALAFVSFFGGAEAMKLVPFSHSFAPTKSEGTIQYYLTNTSNETMAFEVAVFKREQDEKGNDKPLVKDESSFVVFPSKVVVGPKKTRIVKVKWIGNEEFTKNPGREQAFRVSFEQFFVSFDKKKKKKGVSITMKLRLLASLFMTPENAQEKIVVLSNCVKDGDVVIRVRNEGTKRILGKDIKTEVVVFGERKCLGEVLSSSDRDGSVLAGAERVFIVKKEKKTVSCKSVSGNNKTRSGSNEPVSSNRK